MTHVFKRLSTLVLFIFITITTPLVGFSQGDVLGPNPPKDQVTSFSTENTEDEGDPGDGGCDPLDPGCPIDGGLSALLVLGAGYGIKKIRDTRKAVDPE